MRVRRPQAQAEPEAAARAVEDREGALNERLQDLVVQAREHGTEHHELFLVTLSNLSGRHLAHLLPGEHEEHVYAEGLIDALLHLSNVLPERVYVHLDLPGGLHSVLLRRSVKVDSAARLEVILVVARRSGHDERRIDDVVDGVSLLLLLMLKLPHVAERDHAGRFL